MDTKHPFRDQTFGSARSSHIYTKTVVSWSGIQKLQVLPKLNQPNPPKKHKNINLNIEKTLYVDNETRRVYIVKKIFFYV